LRTRSALASREAWWLPVNAVLICVRLVPTPGHTPGHASVFIESEGEELVELGDVVVHDLQLADPGHFHGPERFSRQGKGFSWSSFAEEGEAAVE
jgi:glyoxylase-like metal-dependent hydrolase (beta-lactamase superfamily II)